MADRKPLGKKLRFEVFKRDGFRCQYCGQTPPAVVLHVDHIHPVAKGGSDDIDNLITSCQPCNSGKRDGLLSSAPATVAEKAAKITEAEEQLKAYRRLCQSKKRREDRDIDAIDLAFQRVYPGQQFAHHFRESVRLNFIPYVEIDRLVSAMDLACSRMPNPDRAIKYFCGVAWNLRREAGR